MKNLDEALTNAVERADAEGKHQLVYTNGLEHTVVAAAFQTEYEESNPNEKIITVVCARPLPRE